MMIPALLKKGINCVDTVISEILIRMDQHEYYRPDAGQHEPPVGREDGGVRRAKSMKVLSSYTIG